VSCFAAKRTLPRELLYARPALIDVGGRRINIYCSGAGSPTVILDAGLGGSTADSGHYIQIDQPSAVISAVDEVVDRARYRGRP
jgi:hypothetical protein